MSDETAGSQDHEEVEKDREERRRRAPMTEPPKLGDIQRNAPPDPAPTEQGLYRLTRQGLTRAREIRWR